MTTQLCPLEERISGNITPSCWYKIFKTCNKPDLIAITILGEILFKYRTGEILNGKWRVSYSYFENKFEFSKNQIRSALTRLESLKIVTRQILTEVINNHKYGGVLYLQFDYKNLQAIQEKTYPSLKQNITPPYEKSEPNKNSNKIILNSNDIKKINSNTNEKYTLEHCNEVLEQIKTKYPNLIFASKSSLINYLRKALKTFSKTAPKVHTSIEKKNALISASACDFNEAINKKIKGIVPGHILNKVLNSFLLLDSKKESCVIQVLCDRDLILPYEKALLKAAEEILFTSSVSFKYHQIDFKSCTDLFAALKLKLYFMHGPEMYFGWFDRLSFGSFSKGECILFAPSQFIRDWLYEYYNDTIFSCLESLSSSAKSLEIVVKCSLGN